MKMLKCFAVSIFIFVLCTGVWAQGTDFSYQGNLTNTGSPANGQFDFEFALFESPLGGPQVGSTLTRTGITATNGIFSVNLDFGASFPGAERWLEIRVRTSGGGAFTTLAPRQRIASSPYAVKSLTADNAANAVNATTATTATNATTATGFSGSLAGDVTGTQGATTVARLRGTTVSADAPANGQVLKFNSGTSQWQPATDETSTGGGGGTITGVTAGTGLVGGGSSGNVAVSIANGGVNTLQLADGSVTDAKVVGINAAKVVGVISNATIPGASVTGAVTNATNAVNAGTAINFSGNLNGDLTGTQSGTAIAANAVTNAKIANNSVTATKIATGEVVKSINTLKDNVTLAAGSNITITPSGNTLTIASSSGGGILNQTTLQTGASFNIDGNGTAGGALSGGVVNATTQYNIGGTRQFTANGPFNSGSSNFTASNSFLGERSGINTVPDPSITDLSGKFNSFFGAGAGEANISGSRNAYFGTNAGRSASGSFNAHFGVDADVAGSGSRNVFVGYTAYSKGNDNTAVGYAAGTSSSGATQMNTTAIGSSSRITGDIQFATAIGAGSNVNTSNTVVLGRAADTVQIPGSLNITANLNVTGTFTPAITDGANITNISASNVSTGTLNSARLGIVPVANGGTGSASQNFVDLTTAQNVAGNKTFSGTLSGNVVNATTQFNLGGNRILSNSGTNNLFAGAAAGLNTTGISNAFFGQNAGFTNSSGSSNAFVGQNAGFANTTGSNNAFFGQNAGFANTTGNRNAFFGQNAGIANTSGADNAFFGRNAGINSSTGSFNAFFGHEAGVSNTGGSLNTFVGASAGQANTAGDYNTFFGTLAGLTNSAGDDNTIIGSKADVGGPNLNNATAIGANALVTQGNSVVIGSINGVNGATATASVGINTTAPKTRLHVVGNIYVENSPNGVILQSPNGSCFKISVSNAGVLSANAQACP